MMEIIISSQNRINQFVSEEIISLINNKENVVLGLATGSTPLGLYSNLIKSYKENRVSFKNIFSFNLDEYIGLKEDNINSYRYFMNSNLFNHIDIDINNTFIPSIDEDSDNYYLEYDEKIKRYGGIDFQILGIGSNGHIAFNEPGTSFDTLTHVVELKESTIVDNSRFFDSIDKVPKEAVTMGLKSIMNARRIVLIAFGENKAKAIYDLIKNEASDNLPASILKSHNNVTIYLDYDAASMILRNED